MDQKEHQIHSLDICNRLHNFFMKIVSAHAFKTVKFGHSIHQNLAKSTDGVDESDHKVHPMTQGVAPSCEPVKQGDSMKNSDTFASSCSSSNDHEQDGKELPTIQDNDVSLGTGSVQEGPPLPYSLVAQAKPAKIKKTVSINDRVEEIDTKKMKRKSTKKLPSIDLEEDIVQPLKSILKKDSLDDCDLDENSIFVIHCDSN